MTTVRAEFDASAVRSATVTRKRRVTFRITLAGWLFLLLSVLIGLAAVRSNMPLMFIVFGAMFGGFAISMALAQAMIAGTEVHRELPGRAWQFETVYFGYYLRNHRRYGGVLGLSLRERAPKGVEDACGYCVYLPPGGVFRSGSRLLAEHRGRVDLEGVVLSTRFPFGLAVVRRRIDQPTSLVVWPAKGRLKADLLRHGAMETSSAQPGRLQGGQDEFFGLRDYRSGDNPRWIHWRRSAGRINPVVREMAHPVPDVLMLVLDVQPGGQTLESLLFREKLIRLAATLVDHAQNRGYQVGLALALPTGPTVFSPSNSVDQRCAMLDALAEAGPDPCELAEVLRAIRRPVLSNAQTLLLSPRPDRADRSKLAHLAEASRHLEVLQPHAVEAVFEDNPLLARADREGV
jgi:uncharacterized protein (DUF58 family)